MNIVNLFSIGFDALFDRVCFGGRMYPKPWGSCRHRQSGHCPDCMVVYRREYSEWQQEMGS